MKEWVSIEGQCRGIANMRKRSKELAGFGVARFSKKGK